METNEKPEIWFNHWLEPPDSSEWTEAELQAKLTEAISDRIRNRFPEIMQLAYRIDVREKDFKAALEGSNEMEISERIAKAMISRVKEKIAFRKSYQS